MTAPYVAHLINVCWNKVGSATFRSLPIFSRLVYLIYTLQLQKRKETWSYILMNSSKHKWH